MNFYKSEKKKKCILSHARSKMDCFAPKTSRSRLPPYGTQSQKWEHDLKKDYSMD